MLGSFQMRCHHQYQQTLCRACDAWAKSQPRRRRHNPFAVAVTQEMPGQELRVSQGSTARSGFWKVLRFSLVAAENRLGCRLSSDTCTLRPGACLGAVMHSFVRRTKRCSENRLQLGLSLSVLPESVPSRICFPLPIQKSVSTNIYLMVWAPGWTCIFRS